MRAAKGIAENGRFDAFADLPMMEDITAAFSPEARAAPAVSESVSSDFKGLRRHSRVVCEIALPPRGFRCPGAKRLLGGRSIADVAPLSHCSA
jgi:hypothetical protein